MQANVQTRLIKATWLRDTQLIRTSAVDVILFCKSNGVSEIYVQINRDIQLSDYASFIRMATRHDMKVHALDGRTTWGFKANRLSIDRSFDWLARYQSKVAEDEKFSGIHVDIEPYALPYWEETGVDYIAQWQDNVRYIVQKTRDLRLPITGDIPYWLSSYMAPDGKETLSRWMMRHYGAITIIAYGDTAQDISEMVGAELAEAAALGIPAMVGIEKAHGAEGASLAFFEDSRTRLDEQLGQAADLLKGYGSFAGIAVHDYKAWRAMED